MSLGVYWDRARIGELELTGEGSRDYRFRYLRTERPVSLSLPLQSEPFTPAQSRPFFEALLPEGVVRERIAGSLKLAASDSYGLLTELGRDCAGALQIMETTRISDVPGARWLTEEQLDALIHELPQRPLGVVPGDPRVRLSLAGIQQKAVLVRDVNGAFGEPLNGLPTTHILKPQPAAGAYPDIAVNEYFCMRLAASCGLSVATVELITADSRPCVVVERYDRDTTVVPTRRRHQEDLCQALGLTPDFKYQHPGWATPSYAALAQLLDEHSLAPGADRLAAAQAAILNFLIANADAHAKNISLLHERGGVRLAPLYDLVSTGVYHGLSTELSLGIGDTFDPDGIGVAQWSDLAYDLRLNVRAFGRLRAELAETVPLRARQLIAVAEAEGWHSPTLDQVVALIVARAARL